VLRVTRSVAIGGLACVSVSHEGTVGLSSNMVVGLGRDCRCLSSGLPVRVEKGSCERGCTEFDGGLSVPRNEGEEGPRR